MSIGVILDQFGRNVSFYVEYHWSPKSNSHRTSMTLGQLIISIILTRFWYHWFILSTRPGDWLIDRSVVVFETRYKNNMTLTDRIARLSAITVFLSESLMLNEKWGFLILYHYATKSKAAYNQNQKSWLDGFSSWIITETIERAWDIFATVKARVQR